MKKSEPIISTCSVSLLTIAFEMFSKHNILKLPSTAGYDLERILNVLLHAATSTSNSFESASNDLKRKNFEEKIPSLDTIFNYINSGYNKDVKLKIESPVKNRNFWLSIN